MSIPAIRSFPYDSTGGDAGPYDAEYFALIQQAHLGSYTRRTTASVLLGVGNGTQESLLVEETSPQSLGVTVREGWAMVNNRTVQVSVDTTVPILQNNDPSLDDRIDSIVLRTDKSTPVASLVAKQGTVAAAPVPPNLTQNATVWEVRIANVTVQNGAASILTADIDNSVRVYARHTLVKEGGTGFQSYALGDLLAATATDTLSKLNIPDGKVLVRDTAEANSWNSRFLGLEQITVPTVLGAPAASVNISSIPAKYRDLLLIVKARTSAASAQLNITFNSDTGTSYSINQALADNAAAQTNSGANNQAAINLGNSVVGSAGTALYFGNVALWINQYRSAGLARQGYWNASAFSSAASLVRSHGVYGWENVADVISSIQLSMSSGNIDTGSLYALYGIGRDA